MNFGKDKAGKRIKPIYKGRAACELCEGELYAYACRSRLRQPGWRHKSVLDCDSWWEPETDWHRQWKAHFEDSWHERPMFDAIHNERHRADIRCPSGLVLEFQNSHISPEEIESREKLYGDMLWVVNGKEFTDRFLLFETLTDEQMYLHTDRKEQLQTAQGRQTKKEQALKDQMDRAKVQRDALEYELQRDLKRIEELRLPGIEAGEILRQVIALGTDTRRLRYAVKGLDEGTEEEIDRFKVLLGQWRAASEEADALSAAAKRLSEMSYFRDTSLVEVKYDLRQSNHWENLSFVHNSELEDLFITYRRFERRTDFLAHQRRSHENVYLFNPEPEKARCVNGSSASRAKALAIMGVIEAMIAQWVSKQSGRLNKELEELIEKHRAGSTFECGLRELKQAFDVLETNLAEAREAGAIEEWELEESMDEKRYRIDLVFTEMFRYRWKHKRAVWNFSSAPMFFDFGDDFLYRRLDGDFVHRIGKDEFLEHVVKVQTIPDCPNERPHRITYSQSRGLG